MRLDDRRDSLGGRGGRVGQSVPIADHDVSELVVISLLLCKVDKHLKRKVKCQTKMYFLVIQKPPKKHQTGRKLLIKYPTLFYPSWFTWSRVVCDTEKSTTPSSSQLLASTSKTRARTQAREGSWYCSTLWWCSFSSMLGKELFMYVLTGHESGLESHSARRRMMVYPSPNLEDGPRQMVSELIRA